jgi:hypothetical protein
VHNSCSCCESNRKADFLNIRFAQILFSRYPTIEAQ